jgi:hypothetical protein
VLAIGSVAAVGGTSYGAEYLKTKKAAEEAARVEREEREAERVREQLERQREFDQATAAATAEQQRIENDAEIGAVLADPVRVSTQLALAAESRLIGPARELEVVCDGRLSQAEIEEQAAEQELNDNLAKIPAWLQDGIGRVLTRAAVVALGFVVLAGGYLDYTMFDKTFGSKSIAAAFTPITIISVALCGVALGLGLGWHRRTSEEMSRHTRAAIAAAGLIGLIFSLSWLTHIAPNRTNYKYDNEISAAQTSLTNLGPVTGDAQAAAAQATAAKGIQGQIAQWQKQERNAAAGDQASVAIVSVAEVPLVEGALLACQLLAIAPLRRRKRDAEDEVLAAQENLIGAQQATLATFRRFVAETTTYLDECGVADPVAAVSQGWSRAQQYSALMTELFSETRPATRQPAGSAGAPQELNVEDEPAAAAATPTEATVDEAPAGPATVDVSIAEAPAEEQRDNAAPEPAPRPAPEPVRPIRVDVPVQRPTEDPLPPSLDDLDTTS